MNKWLTLSFIAVALSACTHQFSLEKQAQFPAREVGGAEVHYQPYHLDSLRPFQLEATLYPVEKNPQTYSRSGYASWYGEELRGQKTMTGELLNPDEMVAAHASLPLPSYVRVINLTTGQQLIVKLNDRGPIIGGKLDTSKVIHLSLAAAKKLALEHNTKVRVDFINVTEDESLSGPGTIGAIIAKRSYPLPSRPDLKAVPDMLPIVISDNKE